MKITRIDAFQVRWTPDEKPTQHSAFVRIHTDDGIDGIFRARRLWRCSSCVLRGLGVGRRRLVRRRVPWRIVLPIRAVRTWSVRKVVGLLYPVS